jgi:hypothetical protein
LLTILQVILVPEFSTSDYQTICASHKHILALLPVYYLGNETPVFHQLVLKTLPETIHMITSITNIIPVKYFYAGRTTPLTGATSTTPAAATASMPESKSAFDFAMDYLANDTNTPSSHSPTTNAMTQFTTSPPPATTTLSPSPAAKCSHPAFDEETIKYQVSLPLTSLNRLPMPNKPPPIPLQLPSKPQMTSILPILPPCPTNSPVTIL